MRLNLSISSLKIIYLSFKQAEMSLKKNIVDSNFFSNSNFSDLDMVGGMGSIPGSEDLVKEEPLSPMTLDSSSNSLLSEIFAPTNQIKEELNTADSIHIPPTPAPPAPALVASENTTVIRTSLVFSRPAPRATPTPIAPAGPLLSQNNNNHLRLNYPKISLQVESDKSKNCLLITFMATSKIVKDFQMHLRRTFMGMF